MFATQHYMDSTPERKRPREDSVDGFGATASFAEHRNKRVQCLPLRSSPRAPSQSLPSPQLPNDEDMMDDVHVSPIAPLQSGQYDHIDTRNGAARMPTPIQPSFAAQIKGQNCEWAGSAASNGGGLNGITNLGHHHAGFNDTRSTPCSMATDSDWHDIQSNRRLPSPISEADSSSAPSAPNMMLDDIDEHSAQESYGCGDHAEASSPPAASTDAEGEGSSPSPSRKGHQRSKHTVNSWTWQPGMKRSFSIGYRSDCEKCRLKVPGHFNHIIIS